MPLKSLQQQIIHWQSFCELHFHNVLLRKNYQKDVFKFMELLNLDYF